MGVSDPTMGLLPIPRLAFFGDAIKNIDISDDEGYGWAYGLKFGDDKVNGVGQWQMRYQYTRLGLNAFPDAYPDSDRLGGRTDVKGHEVIFEYGLAKNVVFGIDYYQDDRIKAAKNRQQIVQADLNIKF